jgi:signal peptidase II
MVTDLATEPASTADQTAAGEAAPTKAIAHRTALIIFGVVAVVVIVLDLITKQLVVAHLTEGEPKRLLGGAVYLSLTRNGGAAFSMGTSVTWVFPLISLVVVGWIIWMTTKLRSLPWAIALGLVLGGALGNVGDRVFRAPGVLRGHVVDFISLLSPYGTNFAIFNVADMALTFGVCLAVLLELLGRHRDGRIIKDQPRRAAGSPAHAGSPIAGSGTPAGSATSPGSPSSAGSAPSAGSSSPAGDDGSDDAS